MDVAYFNVLDSESMVDVYDFQASPSAVAHELEGLLRIREALEQHIEQCNAHSALQ